MRRRALTRTAGGRKRLAKATKGLSLEGRGHELKRGLQQGDPSDLGYGHTTSVATGDLGDDALNRGLSVSLRLREHLLQVPQQLDFGPQGQTEIALVQLSFCVNRQNYLSLLANLQGDHVIPACMLARALLEESIRWEWLTDDPDRRRPLLIQDLKRNIRNIETACSELGVSPTPFTNPSPFFRLPSPSDTGQRFPPIEQMLRDKQALAESQELEVQFKFESIYAMYRVLSQLTHTSLLGMIATVQPETDEDLSIARRLPRHLLALVLQAAGASVFNVSQYTVHSMFELPRQADTLSEWLLKGFSLVSELAEEVGPLHGLTTY